MTWRPEVPADFAGEAAKIKWRAVPYVMGVGLDIGCGPWKAFSHSIGLDGHAYAVGDNRGPNLIMDCRSLAMFSPAIYDYIFSSHFLEHVEDPEAVLKEWWRVIKVGGYLILYLPHKLFYPNIGQPGANPDHKHDYLPDDIVRIMKRVGGWDLVEKFDHSDDYNYSFFQVYRKRDDALHVDLWDQPKRAKTAAIVRPGNFGDALWASSIAYQLKREGYHVTAYVEPMGEAVLRHDPNIDKIVLFSREYVNELEFGKFWLAEAPRYDRWINLTQSIEVNLLMVPGQLSYFWPAAVRRSSCNKNYVEFMHDVAGVPYELQQRFFPTPDEARWAKKTRGEYKGRCVVLVNGGSTAPKWWPYAPVFTQLLAELGVHTFVVGDLKGLEFPDHPLVHVQGEKVWTIRESIAFAQVVDAVVGQETGVLNAVAIEDVAKVVMLSHSTVENLTRDWRNTVSLHGNPKCYPCHRIHYDHKHCAQDPLSKAALCQADITIESVMDALESLGVLTADDKAKLMAPVEQAA